MKKKRGNLYPTDGGSFELPDGHTPPPVPQVDDDDDDNNKKVKIALGVVALVVVGIVAYQYFMT